MLVTLNWAEDQFKLCMENGWRFRMSLIEFQTKTWIVFKKRFIPYVVIEIVNFYLANAAAIDFGAETNFLARYKMFLIGKMQ